MPRRHLLPPDCAKREEVRNGWEKDEMAGRDAPVWKSGLPRRICSPVYSQKRCEIAPLFFKTIGSEGNKKRQVVSVTVCRPCTVFSCYLGSYLSSKGKSRFCIYEFETLKNGVWVAKKPDKLGLFAGYIFFVPF